MAEKKKRPSKTPEGREKQVIALAVALAEKQLREGTASAQVITHYLKMGSPKEQLEREKLLLETEHIKAKTEAVKAQARIDELYNDAMKAMSVYDGTNGEEP